MASFLADCFTCCSHKRLSNDKAALVRRFFDRRCCHMPEIPNSTYRKRLFHTTVYGSVPRQGNVRLTFDADDIRLNHIYVPWNSLVYIKGKGHKLVMVFNRFSPNVDDEMEIVTNAVVQIELDRMHNVEQILNYLLRVSAVVPESYGFWGLKRRYINNA